MSNFDRPQGHEPARLRRRGLGVRPRNLIHLSRTARSRTRRWPLIGRASRSALHPISARARWRRVSSGARRYARHAARRSSRRSTRASPGRSRTAPTASSGRTGPRARRSSSPTGCGWTPTTTTTPANWIGAMPGFMTGGGFPMRFADLDGTLDRRLPAEHESDRRVDVRLRRRDRALLDNALGPQGYYGAFGTNIHTDYPAPLRASKRSWRPRRPEGCR